MEEARLLYGDLVRFIVEFQNLSGRNIQYNNFLLEMGNWSSKPGFNPESNDQFSKIVNNCKKPVNAYYKYNNQIIHHLCGILDSDISIFPTEINMRSQLMKEILEKLCKNENKQSVQYKNIEGCYIKQDFVNFMTAVFELAHYNSVIYFNNKLKEEKMARDGCPSPGSENITPVGTPVIVSADILPGNIPDNSYENQLMTNHDLLLASFVHKKRTALRLACLVLLVMAGTFLFSLMNSYKSYILPANSQVQAGNAVDRPGVDSPDSGYEKKAEITPGAPAPDKPAKNGQQETQKENGAGSAKSVNGGPAQATSSGSGEAAPKNNGPEAQKRSSEQKSGQDKKDNGEKDNKASITINGNGIFTIGDNNVINVR
ncbi:hypothetical protein CLHUN_18180 [Ruminiclostridium hungatei]|uniref:Uncharacterized protein n=1 Tax=Ruminiclostridium hungatei TaxID=48256 RepID=A0A1V4SKB9_RUMHU|nr:hypothetical protein [Ruminiclostridium hungatei]OPX44264.1 hypothetical protein CLHUN_18180 [Ruminiclostridium hungatei]